MDVLNNAPHSDLFSGFYLGYKTEEQSYSNEKIIDAIESLELTFPDFESFYFFLKTRCRLDKILDFPKNRFKFYVDDKLIDQWFEF